jgi:hypothetical protein
MALERGSGSIGVVDDVCRSSHGDWTGLVRTNSLGHHFGCLGRLAHHPGAPPNPRRWCRTRLTASPLRLCCYYEGGPSLASVGVARYAGRSRLPGDSNALTQAGSAARRNVRKASSASMSEGRSRRPARRGDTDREIIASRPPRPFSDRRRDFIEEYRAGRSAPER